jgi:N utilization substance protein B
MDVTGSLANDISSASHLPDTWRVRGEDASEWPEQFRDDRRRARAVAIQVLYEVDLTRRDPISILNRRVIDDMTPNVSAFAARAMVAGVVARRIEIDRSLAEGAPQWPVDRIDPVERSILRLAIFELLNGRADGDRAVERVPVRVAINEAVELARLFGTEASVRFVNGVLGAVARQNYPDEAGVRATPTSSAELLVRDDGEGLAVEPVPCGDAVRLPLAGS